MSLLMMRRSLLREDGPVVADLMRMRQLGQGVVQDHVDVVRRRLYRRLGHALDAYDADHQGIFNLSFNPEGSLVVACCENNALLLLDPRTRRPALSVEAAHRSCVNTARFLDMRTLASCSDDTTVALWDVRRLTRGPSRVLHGHTSWVKNVEYCPNSRLLVTSGFDDIVHTWDLSRQDEHLRPTVALQMEGLMRMRLAGGGELQPRRMVVAFKNGFLLIIHNLSLPHLHSDLKNFDAGLFRMTQLTGRPTDALREYLQVFTRDRNRVELVTDFPDNDDAELVASLDVEPLHGLVAVSRNTSEDQMYEWTCVHDISDRGSVFDVEQVEDSGLKSEEHRAKRRRRFMRRRDGDEIRGMEEMSADEQSIDRNRVAIDALFYAWRSSVRSSESTDPTSEPLWWTRNRPRLTHFIEEANTSLGYIKELAFSPDGRLIASPFANGLRILAFNQSMHNISDCQLPSKPTQLFEVTTVNGKHKRTVVSTAFSPNQYTLVTGCLAGRLVWYEPKL